MNHQHIAERCQHGETKQTLCDHRVAWSAYRVREVPCAPGFCRLAEEASAPGRDPAGVVSGYAFTTFATVRLVANAPDLSRAVAQACALEGEEHDIQSLRALGFVLEAVTFGEAGDIEFDTDE